MSEVLNKRSLPPVGSPEVARIYVGRPSKWGNPFVIKRDGTREQVVSMYRDWLLNSPDSPIADIEELRGVDLVCWCAPAACHADVLLQLANLYPAPDHQGDTDGP